MTDNLSQAVRTGQAGGVFIQRPVWLERRATMGRAALAQAAIGESCAKAGSR